MPSTVGIVASGEDVLNDAVFWVDAGRSSVSNGALTNLGTGGSALNAVFGNTTGVDSFDPALLTHTGTNYLYLPGLSNNTATSPDSTALDITGDIEIEWIGTLDWTTSGDNGVLIGKEATGQRSFTLRRTNAAKTLTWVWTADGSTVNIKSSTSDVPSNTNAVKVTFDVDNGAGGNTVTFFTSSNFGASYSQLGSAVVSAGTASIFSGTAQLEIGAGAVSGPLLVPASVYRCIIRNGIGGTTAFDADFTTGITSGAQTTFTESSANAATVTINRATSGRKSVAVTRPILLFGTDDYLQVADNDLLDFGASDSLTVVAVLRAWGNPFSNNALVSKVNFGSLPSAGWQLYWNGTTLAPKIVVSDGTVLPNVGSNTTLSSGALGLVGVARDTTADLLRTYTNTVQGSTTTDTTTGSLANALPLRIGTRADSVAQTSDFELVAAAVWRRTLNANEIATIVNRYT